MRPVPGSQTPATGRGSPCFRRHYVQTISSLGFDGRNENVRQVEGLRLLVERGEVLVDQCLELSQQLPELAAELPRGLAHALRRRPVALEDGGVQPAEVRVELGPPLH